MIRALIVLLLLVVSGMAMQASGLNATIVESTPDYLVFDVQFDSVSIIRQYDGEEWHTHVVLPGAGSLVEPGSAALPVTSLMLGIPATSRPTLNVLHETVETRHVGPVKRIDSPTNAVLESSMARTSWEPQRLAELGTDGMLRYQRVLQLRLFPVRYQASSQMAQITKAARLRIDFNAGTSNAALPVADPKFESTYKSVLQNYEESKQWRQSTASHISLQKVSTTHGDHVKLFIKKAGVYSLTGRQLVELGVDIRSINPQWLALTHKGEPVPILVEGRADGHFDVDDRLLFVGEHNRGDDTYLSFYSDTNVYMLTWSAGTGMRFAELVAAPNGTERDTLSTAPAHVHLEEDTQYQRMVGYDGEGDDHWFWKWLENDIDYKFPVQLPGVTPQSSLKMTAAFHGLTRSRDVELNHHVVAKLDGVQIGDAWGSDDKPFTLYTAPFQVPEVKSSYDLTLTLPADMPGIETDHVFLNWVHVQYDRQLQADAQPLAVQLTPQDHAVWRSSGFDTDRVYFLTNNGYRLIEPQMRRRSTGFEFLFTYPSVQPSTLHMVTENQIQPVPQLELDTPSDLRNPGNQADYIIITHEKFKSAAQRLADYRASTGLHTMIVDIQDIYDEFNGGIFDPRAIKRFMSYAFHNWSKPAPLYFVLFGDTVILMDKDAAASSPFESFIPSYMVNTKSFGMTSSDNYFAAINGDDELPDVYLGRLPSNTLDEAETMVEKIITYETQEPAATWRRNLALVSGNGPFFSKSAQNLVDHHLPKWLDTKRLSTDFDSEFYNPKEDFIDWLNSGQNIVNFLVHGGGEQIADDNLFEKDDMIRLNDTERYAFAVTMSCYIGHFDHPEKSSLGEALLTAPNKGFMGFFGSAGKSYQYADFHFNNSFFEGLFEKNLRTLGELTVHAKYDLIAKTRGFWEPVQNFMLLGDPASRLVLPEENIELQLSKRVLTPGDVLSVSGTAPTVPNGTLTLSVLSAQDSVLAEQQVALENGAFNLELFTLTPQLRQKWGDFGGLGTVRAHATDNTQHAVGSTHFSVVRPLISRFELEPSHPIGFEPVHFVVEISPDVAAEVGGIQNMHIKWAADDTWNELSMAKQSESEWRSTSPLSHEEGTVVRYKLVMTSGTATTETEVQEYRVLYKPDVYLDTNVRLFSTPQHMLELTVKNRGESDARNVQVQVQHALSNTLLSDGFVVPHVTAREDTTVRVAISSLSAGAHDILLRLDPENTLDEEEESNNELTRTVYVVQPDVGSNGVFRYFNNDITLSFPEQSTNGTASVDVTVLNASAGGESLQSSSLTLLKSLHVEKPSLYELNLSDSATVVSAPIRLTLACDPDDSTTAHFWEQNAVRIYGWDAHSRLWKGLETTRVAMNYRVAASLPGNMRRFAIMASTDTQAPNIRLDVEGQHFVSGDVVSTTPTFLISLEDSSGIDVSPASLNILLDGQPLYEADYVMTLDPKHSSKVQITLTPELFTGEHDLKVQVQDWNGNAASQEVSFIIGEEFGVEFIANHPNPFPRETTIAFTIRDMASEVNLDIYTVSGRLIRSFDFTDITGYNEVEWDGADRDGNEIANGVYYLKFVARKNDERIERIEKLAKLK